MTEGDYLPSPVAWVREQVDAYEASGGRTANTLRDTGLPIVVLTMRGARTGKIRKAPVMRVEHEGEYAIVASKGGAPSNPAWYHNLLAHPDDVMLQDGPEPFPVSIRQLAGQERGLWWQRAVAAFPPYADYQQRTTRTIPVLLATRK
jgi:deazaflavin-dependent oxidoreductase (nitroreductase family)